MFDNFYIEFLLFWIVPTPFAVWYGLKFSKSYKELTGIRVAGFVVGWFIPFFNWFFAFLLGREVWMKYKDRWMVK